MIYSMTGFGKAEKTNGERTYIAEVKTLNGKQFDLQLKLPALLKPFEFDIRSKLQETLIRGTVDCIIFIKQQGSAKPVVINTDLVKSYYQQISSLAADSGMDMQSVLASILRLPEVVSPSTEVLSAEDFKSFLTVLEEAITQLQNHRQKEGAVLEQDLLMRVEKIREQESVILSLESNRMDRIRQELGMLLEKYVGKENYDAGRMEQELVYYMEKIDIHEEQIRLKQHIDFFIETLNGSEVSKGKKLSFILQEMGREINTTGSKAYDIDIQKSVVVMKDELEKAKEQVLNIL